MGSTAPMDGWASLGMHIETSISKFLALGPNSMGVGMI